MEKVIYNLVFNRKKRLNAEGKALIQVEAYLNRQKKYFSTKIYVKPTQWDSKRKAVRNHPNMDELNQYIEDYITYLERIELDMVQSGRPFSLKYLRERGDFESVSSSFVSFMKNEIKEYKEYIKQQAADPDVDKKALAQQLLVRIGFYQHERLIHLIVTMSFAIFFLLSLILVSINVYFLALSVLLLVLLVPYIAHYYFLENSTQELYKVYYSLISGQ